MKERLGAEHCGAERQETMAEHAEAVVAQEMKRRQWNEAELGRRAKGDAQKVTIAVRLRAETTMTVKWIAQRLQMGAPGHVNHLLMVGLPKHHCGIGLSFRREGRSQHSPRTTATQVTFSSRRHRGLSC